MHQKLPYALLFFLTMVVKADGRKLRNSIAAVEASQNFNTSRATVKKVWKKYKDQCLSPSLENPVACCFRSTEGQWTQEEVEC
jgi:hypothetical protein